MPRSPSRSRSRSCSSSSSSGHSSRGGRVRRRHKRPDGAAKLSKSFDPVTCFSNLVFLSWCASDCGEAPASLSDSALNKLWKKFVKRWNSGKLPLSSYAASRPRSSVPAHEAQVISIAPALAPVSGPHASSISTASLIGPSAVPNMPLAARGDAAPVRKGPMLPPSGVDLEHLSKQTQSLILTLLAWNIPLLLATLAVMMTLPARFLRVRSLSGA